MRKSVVLIIFVFVATIVWFAFNSKSWVTLSNGEVREVSTDKFNKVIHIENPEIENIFLYIVFPSGEFHNPYTEGLAHYLEHLVWHNAFGRKEDESIQSYHSNAWTTLYSTVYSQVTISNKLNISLEKLVSVVNPISIDPKFALEERKIIIREYDYRFKDDHLYPVFREISKLINRDSPLSRSILGTPPEIMQYSLENARALHEKNYNLSSATIIAYGGVSLSEIKSAVQSLKEVKIKQNLNQPEAIPLPEIKVLRDEATVYVPNLVEDVFIYRKIVQIPECKNTVQCELITQIIKGAIDSAMPGGIAGPLRFKEFIARTFYFDMSIVLSNYVDIVFTARADKGVSLNEVQGVFEAAFNQTLEEGIPKETYNRVLKRFKDNSDSFLDLNRAEYNVSLALQMLTNGKPIYTWSDEKKALNNISLNDVNEFLRELSEPGSVVIRHVYSNE